MVKWLERCAYDQHGPSSKPTCNILLCLWERHFTALSPAWWSWQAVLFLFYLYIYPPDSQESDGGANT